MRKHSTGMRNLELMKWCTYYGINNLYNILVGFAGETAEDYRLAMRRDRQDRSSAAALRDRPGPPRPRLADVHRSGQARCRPVAALRLLSAIFPRGRFDLNQISYYFDHDGPGMLPDQDYDDIFRPLAPGRNGGAGAKADAAIPQVMRFNLHRGLP